MEVGLERDFKHLLISESFCLELREEVDSFQRQSHTDEMGATHDPTS